MVAGMIDISHLDVTGVFRRRVHTESSTKEEFLADAMEAFDEIEAGFHKPDADKQLWDTLLLNQERGFPEVGPIREQMDQCWGRRVWRPVPTFDFLQPCGKHRMTSDAKRGGHNNASAADVKLDLVAQLHPLLHARTFYEAAKQLKVPEQVLVRLQLVSGSEGMPDAYNWCPATPGDLCVNNQGLFNPHEGTWRYQKFRWNLVGLIHADINFNRVPRFMQAVARSWLAFRLSTYFDDVSIQDINSGQDQAQLGVRTLFKLVGFRVNPERSSHMQAERNLLE
jgi:hypothetical protein